MKLQHLDKTSAAHGFCIGFAHHTHTLGGDERESPREREGMPMNCPSLSLGSRQTGSGGGGLERKHTTRQQRRVGLQRKGNERSGASQMPLRKQDAGARLACGAGVEARPPGDQDSLSGRVVCACALVRSF